MEIRGLGFVPLVLALWCVAWLSASYTLTIINGHAPPLMLISEAGSFYPESVLFTIGFVGMSIATVVLTFLQYNFIMFHSETFGPRQGITQKVLLAIGWSSCAATAVMASFSTEYYTMTHRVAAFIAFGLGGFYNLWQAILLYKVPGSRRVVCHIRVASCVMAIAFILIFIGCRVSMYTHPCGEACIKIIDDISKIIEWLMLLLILINVLTYYQNMQSLTLTVSWKGLTISQREENQDSGV